MAARVSFNKVTITEDGAELFTGAQLVVRDNVAKVFGRAALRDRKEGVTAVEQRSRKLWAVVFEDGTEWAVVKEPGCGCG